MATYERRRQEEPLWLAPSSLGHPSHEPGDADRTKPASADAATKYAPTQQSARQQPGSVDHHTPAGSYAYPAIVNLDGELIQVSSQQEAEEARTLLGSIQLDYGVQVSSQKGLEALRQQYDQLPAPVKAQLRTDVWQLKELRALQRALAHFKPLLGQQRIASGHGGIPQQVISISKLREAATQNSPTGKLDGDERNKTSGEFFSQGRNFSLFSAASRQTVDGLNNDESLEATASHELAHGLLGYRLVDFVSAIGYWQDAFDTLSRPGAEKPITLYGESAPAEDLAETVKFYFVNRAKLQDRCPKRFEFMRREVATWNATPSAK